MASEIQYKVFKELFDEETRRYSDLDNKGKLYVTIITFYLGAIAFKLRDVAEFTNSVPYAKWFYLAIAAMLVIALLFAILGIRVRSFEGIFDPEKIIASLGPVAPTDEEFLDDRIVDLAVSTNKNSRRNDKVASSLASALFCVFIAGATQFILLVVAMINLH